MGVGDVLGGIGSVLGGMGQDASGGGGSSSSQSLTGYYAMPPIEQAPYNNLFNAVNAVGSMQPVISPPNGSFSNYNINPNSLFYSQGLGSLQAANPNTPMNPTGFIEPFNSVQQSALSAYANPNSLYSTANLAPYMNPYQNQVLGTTLNTLQQQHDQQQNSITDQMNATNPYVLGNSALGTEYALNNQQHNQDAANFAANLGYQGYNSSIDILNQAIANKINAGNIIQAQNQQALGIANPINYAQTQYQLNPSYIQASALSPLFSAFPGASSSTSQSQYVGATPILGPGQSAAPTATQRLGGLFMQAGNPTTSLGSLLSGLF